MILQHTSATIIIGKNGLTNNVIKNIKNKLKEKKIIKIKILPTYIKGKDKTYVFNDIAKKTNSRIVRKIGFTLILKK